MFTPSRYVVVDDHEDELQKLVGVLHGLRVPCLPFHYKAETGLKGVSLSGVRLLFLDVHLNGAPMTGGNADYTEIVQLLEDCVDPKSGPYILILWTKHLEKNKAIVDYIERAVTPSKKPLTVLGLDKNKYLAPPAEGESTLEQDVKDAVRKDPRVLALINWEHDVLAAAGATLAELGALVPDDERSPDKYGRALDGILSALAVAAAGKQNSQADPRAAVNAALAPILADRIVNQRGDEQKTELWKQAVTRAADLPQVSEAQAGRMNAMVHIVRPDMEVIRASDWGAAIAPPPNVGDAFWDSRTGMTSGKLLNDIFQIAEKKGRQACRLVMVRIGAVCDYAQNKPGPKPYVIGTLRPLTALRAERPRLLGENVSPIFVLSDGAEPQELITNGRLFVTSGSDEFNDWQVLFRIREQLLMQIATVSASHSVRPGLLEFRGE